VRLDAFNRQGRRLLSHLVAPRELLIELVFGLDHAGDGHACDLQAKRKAAGGHC